MSRLIILRGNSGSGKSTVAKELRYSLGYETMLIPQDVLRREILRVKDDPGNPSIQLIYDTAMYGKHIGYDVIIEGILPNKHYGDMLRELAGNFSSQNAYYFDISFEETLRRHNTKCNAHEFGEKEMREWWIENDVLEIPGEKIVTESFSKDEIVRLILSDVESRPEG